MPHDVKCELRKFVETWNSKATVRGTDQMITDGELAHLRQFQSYCFCRFREQEHGFLVTFKMMTENGQQILEWVKMFREVEWGKTDTEILNDHRKEMGQLISVDFRNRKRI